MRIFGFQPFWGAKATSDWSEIHVWRRLLWWEKFSSGKHWLRSAHIISISVCLEDTGRSARGVNELCWRFTIRTTTYLPTQPCFCLRTATTEKTSGSFTGNLNLSGNQWNISQAVIITEQSSVLDHTRWLHQHFVYHPINITAKASQSKISTQQLSGGSVPLAPNRSLVPPAAWDPRPNRCVVKRWCVA
jgi:hypothetical protein